MLYLTAERFMYGFVSALTTQTTLAFKEALRAIDVSSSTTCNSFKAARRKPNSATR